MEEEAAGAEVVVGEGAGADLLEIEDDHYPTFRSMGLLPCLLK